MSVSELPPCSSLEQQIACLRSLEPVLLRGSLNAMTPLMLSMATQLAPSSLQGTARRNQKMQALWWQR